MRRIAVCAVVACAAALLALVDAGATVGLSWTTYPVPSATVPSGAFSAVSCPSGSADCMAVGSSAAGAIAERWDGREWSIEPVPSGRGQPLPYRGLTTVSCVAGNDCVAAGASNSGRSLIVRWDGKNWSPQRPAAGTGLPVNSVSCGSKRMCIAVATDTGCGDSCETVTEVQRWDGRKWSLRGPRFHVGGLTTP